VERRRIREDPQEYQELPYIGLEHIREQQFGLHGKSRSEEYQSTSVHFFPGDILYGRLRPYLNKVHLTDFEGLGSGEIIVLNPMGEIYSRYLAHLLNSQEFVRYANHRSTGDRPRVNYNKIKEFEVPIPPLAEQKSIVNKIEKLFSKLDSGVSELKNAESRLEQYRRAVLKAGISGSLSESCKTMEQDSSTIYQIEDTELFTGSEILETNNNYPDDWRITTLDQISDVETGATPLRGNDEYWGGDIPWIKSGAVNQAKIEFAEEFITKKALDETSVTIFPPETLIVAMYTGTRGKHSILKIEATTNQACAGIIIPDENSHLRSWVDIYLSHFYNDLQMMGAGSVQLNLNLGIIRSLEVPIPPKKEIEYICDIVERQLSIIEDTNHKISKNLEFIKILRQSILKRAFEGTLVPQYSTGQPPTPENGDTKPDVGAQASHSEVSDDVE
jgi:type I restriction enzyme S subunit